MDTVIINVTIETPKHRKGYYVRFADGIIVSLDGNADGGGWLDGTFPIKNWTQHGSRFDALADYSDDKRAATKLLATPATPPPGV